MAKQASRVDRRNAAGKKLLSDALERVKKGHTDVALEIGSPISGEAVRGLLDDWLVPMIVDGIIKRLGS